MKKLLIFIFLVKSSLVLSQGTSAKDILLEQLKTTHNKKEWFVPANIAVEGLTPEQALWKDGSGNHSVWQLANHLIFWNERQLAKFKGEKVTDFTGNNEETFAQAADKKAWEETVKRLDRVLSELEKVVKEADEAKLKSWYATLANISTHNAYHTGQIIFVRKLQGSWDAEKGVK